MGESELKIALQREGDEQVRAFWQAAEEQVGKRRRELKAEQEQLRNEAERKLQAEISRRRNKLLAEAQTRAMASRLRAEAAIDDRLRGLAAQLLAELAEDNREDLWQALCAELPPAEWSRVIVSQTDRELASQYFPTAEIESDDRLAGGLIASNHGGTVRVDNSLACRLRRAWPDLLPQMIRAIRTLVDENETA